MKSNISFKGLIKRYPQLSFLGDPEFDALPEENRIYLKELIEDALFWVEHESKPNSGDGFKFLAASYGLDKAHKDADAQGLEGKDREKFIRPHQDLYTMYNPYSGNSNQE